MNKNIFTVERTTILEILNVKNNALKKNHNKETIRKKINRKGLFVVRNF